MPAPPGVENKAEKDGGPTAGKRSRKGINRHGGFGFRRRAPDDSADFPLSRRVGIRHGVLCPLDWKKGDSALIRWQAARQADQDLAPADDQASAFR